MKHQALFSLKDKSKKISVVCCKFLFGTLRISSSGETNSCFSFKSDEQISIYLSASAGRDFYPNVLKYWDT